MTVTDRKNVQFEIGISQEVGDVETRSLRTDNRAYELEVVYGSGTLRGRFGSRAWDSESMARPGWLRARLGGAN